MYLTLKEVWITTAIKIKILVGLALLLCIGMIIGAVYLIRNWLVVDEFSPSEQAIRPVATLSSSSAFDELFSSRLGSEARAILLQHFQTFGGVTRLSSLRSMVFTGKFELEDGVDRDIVIIKKEGGFLRLMIGSETDAIVIGATPESGWRASWRTGRLIMLRDLNRLEREGLVRYAALLSDLFLASRENWEVRYQGLRAFGEGEAHSFEIIPNATLRLQIYIDPQDYTMVGKTEFVEIESGKWEIVHFTFADYQSWGEIKFPATIESRSLSEPVQRIRLTEIQPNLGVLNEVFVRPNPEDHWLIPASMLMAPDQ